MLQETCGEEEDDESGIDQVKSTGMSWVASWALLILKVCQLGCWDMYRPLLKKTNFPFFFFHSHYWETI